MGTNSSTTQQQEQLLHLEKMRNTINDTFVTYKQTLPGLVFAMYGFHKEQFNSQDIAALLNAINKAYGYPEAELVAGCLGGQVQSIYHLQDLQGLLVPKNRKDQSLESKIEELKVMLTDSDPLLVLQSYDADGDDRLTTAEMD